MKPTFQRRTRGGTVRFKNLEAATTGPILARASAVVSYSPSLLVVHTGTGGLRLRPAEIDILSAVSSTTSIDGDSAERQCDGNGREKSSSPAVGKDRLRSMETVEVKSSLSEPSGKVNANGGTVTSSGGGSGGGGIVLSRRRSRAASLVFSAAGSDETDSGPVHLDPASAAHAVVAVVDETVGENAAAMQCSAPSLACGKACSSTTAPQPPPPQDRVSVLTVGGSVQGWRRAMEDRLVSFTMGGHHQRHRGDNGDSNGLREEETQSFGVLVLDGHRGSKVVDAVKTLLPEMLQRSAIGTSSTSTSDGENAAEVERVKEVAVPATLYNAIVDAFLFTDEQILHDHANDKEKALKEIQSAVTAYIDAGAAAADSPAREVSASRPLVVSEFARPVGGPPAADEEKASPSPRHETATVSPKSQRSSRRTTTTAPSVTTVAAATRTKHGTRQLNAASLECSGNERLFPPRPLASASAGGFGGAGEVDGGGSSSHCASRSNSESCAAARGTDANRSSLPLTIPRPPSSPASADTPHSAAVHVGPVTRAPQRRLSISRGFSILSTGTAPAGSTSATNREDGPDCVANGGGPNRSTLSPSSSSVTAGAAVRQALESGSTYGSRSFGGALFPDDDDNDDNGAVSYAGRLDVTSSQEQEDRVLGLSLARSDHTSQEAPSGGGASEAGVGFYTSHRTPHTAVKRTSATTTTVVQQEHGVSQHASVCVVGSRGGAPSFSARGTPLTTTNNDSITPSDAGGGGNYSYLATPSSVFSYDGADPTISGGGGVGRYAGWPALRAPFANAQQDANQPSVLLTPAEDEQSTRQPVVEVASLLPPPTPTPRADDAASAAAVSTDGARADNRLNGGLPLAEPIHLTAFSSSPPTGDDDRCSVTPQDAGKGNGEEGMHIASRSCAKAGQHIDERTVCEVDASSYLADTSGSTALLLFVRIGAAAAPSGVAADSKVVEVAVANLGDCQAFFVERNRDAAADPSGNDGPSDAEAAVEEAKVKAFYGHPPLQQGKTARLSRGFAITKLTNDHRPIVNESEEARLLARFGRSAFLSAHALSKGCHIRTWCEDEKPASEAEEARLARRRVGGRLSVSRAFGDFDLKLSRLPVRALQRCFAAARDVLALSMGDLLRACVVRLQHKAHLAPVVESAASVGKVVVVDNAGAPASAKDAEDKNDGLSATEEDAGAAGKAGPLVKLSQAAIDSAAAGCRGEPLTSALLVSNVPEVRAFSFTADVQQGGSHKMDKPANSGVDAVPYKLLVGGCDGIWELQSIAHIAERAERHLQPILQRMRGGQCQPQVATPPSPPEVQKATCVPAFRRASTALIKEIDSAGSSAATVDNTRSDDWALQLQTAMKLVVAETLQAGICANQPPPSGGIGGDNMSLSITLFL